VSSEVLKGNGQQDMIQILHGCPEGRNPLKDTGGRKLKQPAKQLGISQGDPTPTNIRYELGLTSKHDRGMGGTGDRVPTAEWMLPHSPATNQSGGSIIYIELPPGMNNFDYEESENGGDEITLKIGDRSIKHPFDDLPRKSGSWLTYDVRFPYSGPSGDRSKKKQN
jgi:hypothetical protein